MRLKLYGNTVFVNALQKDMAAIKKLNNLNNLILRVAYIVIHVGNLLPKLR